MATQQAIGKHQFLAIRRPVHTGLEWTRNQEPVRQGLPKMLGRQKWQSPKVLSVPYKQPEDAAENCKQRAIVANSRGDIAHHDRRIFLLKSDHISREVPVI